MEYEFAASLARAAAYFALGNAERGDRFQLLHDRGALLVQQRNRLVERALTMGATHVIFIDTDSAFPHDTFDRLLAHNQPIVGVNFSTRRPPFQGVAMYEHPKGSKNLRLAPIDPHMSGLFEVDVTGTGIVLIEAEVFRRMEKPWFDVQWDERTDGFWSEDTIFSLKARDAGFPIYIDLDLSQEVAHIGKKAYTLAEAHLIQKENEEAEG